jgi:transposase
MEKGTRMAKKVKKVLGEYYELSDQESAEVSEWLAKNPEMAGEFDEEGNLAENGPGSPLEIELALEEVKGRDDFISGLTAGLRKHQKAYELLHPLGGNMAIDDVAKEFKVNRATIYRWMEKLKAQNPNVYDLDRWPTKKQLDAYRLTHPEFGGLTHDEASKLLGITRQAVQQLLDRMRESFPKAFSFERMAEPEHVSYDPSIHDEQIVRKF